LSQTNAKVHASEGVVVGDQPGSVGTYNISGASQLTTPNLVVGKGGIGTVKQDGSEVVVANAQHNAALTIAQDTGSKGSYQINNGGKLYADQIIIGDRGIGALQQKDSTVAVNWAKVGNESSGQGEWTVTNGAVQLGNFEAAVASGQFTNPGG